MKNKLDKKILVKGATILTIAFMATSSLASATGTVKIVDIVPISAPTVEQTPAPINASIETNKPTTEQAKIIESLLRKNKWGSTKFDFVKNPNNPLNNATLFRVYATQSKKANLPGTITTQAFVSKTFVPVAKYKLAYSIEYNIFLSVRNFATGAYIRVYPVSTDEKTFFDFPINASMFEIQNKVTSFYKTRVFSAPSNLAKLDSPQGVKATSDENKALSSLFFSKGWRSVKFDFYKNVPAYINQDTTLNYLEEGDISQAMSVAKSKTKAILPASGFYFSQTVETIPGSTDKFYLELCAYGPIKNTKTGAVQNPEFMWILAKPALTNMDGKFDHYYFAPNTKLNTIQKAMAAHFAGAKELLPSGAIN